ncbi:glycosyltransferase [Glaciihabitans sp. dw_435]|uniref:glycosyltransferase n=1 Tax=Glaciihabitans sp. dw_435 TaxID=2720081 RepID=UPI001BD4784D|nr:nucleotide disphospho-sugar-binding domain-containing protein [Glaciihabitans sp. dw_435]
MATYLLGSTPLYGHAAPLISIGAHLVSEGHRVIMLTGSRFERQVLANGLEFVPLTGRADFDETDETSFVPDLSKYRGLALSQYQVRQTFIVTIPDQYRGLRAILELEQVDAVLVDSMFAGVLPLLSGERMTRPPVIGIGIGPVAEVSRDVAPFNTALAPSSTPLGRLRNRAMNLLVEKVLFAKTQKLAARLIDEVADAPLDRFVLNLGVSFDRFLQLGPAEFEYPRSDLSPNTVFIGPVPPPASTRAPAALPDWWSDLSAGRPVVHVTQGTLDNHDFSKLLRPTLDALANDDVLVVASTGGAPIAQLGVLPANARVAEFLPYDQLLPLTDVMVTNGGFGGVQLALRHGLPLVVAGAAEDKPEVAARVAHFGVGKNLRTGRPTAAAIGAAVRTVLADDSYRRHAQAMATAIAGYSPLEAISRELAALPAAHLR